MGIAHIGTVVVVVVVLCVCAAALVDARLAQTLREREREKGKVANVPAECSTAIEWDWHFRAPIVFSRFARDVGRLINRFCA